jgi:hypothetical protein
MSGLYIPESVLPDVREAILSALHDALQDMEEPLTLPERDRHPEWFPEGRRDIEHIWALLDLTGWRETDETRDLELDLQEYGQTVLITAANHHDLYETWEKEADVSDAARARRGAPPRKAEIFRRGAALREFITGLERQLGES